MSTKRAIKRMFLTLMWIGVGIGMITLISAAVESQEQSKCKGLDIHITGSGEGSLFTSKEQIAQLVEAAAEGDVQQKYKSQLNLPKMEDLLEQSVWVYNAELYFDNKDILHVNITERLPLARVFTTDGISFYIDEAGKHIPLSDKISLDVPVFTGYQDKVVMNATDSALLENMIATASFINSDSFWTAQVSQIDIQPCGPNCWSMVMIPVIGNHRVDLGDGSDIASKMHRLYLFYDQVMKKTGFDKYKKVDVQYDGQVIGVKGNYTKIDSLQLKKNINELLQQARHSDNIILQADRLPGVKEVPTDTNGVLQDTYPAISGSALDDSEKKELDNPSPVSDAAVHKNAPETKPVTQAVKKKINPVNVNKENPPKSKEDKKAALKKSSADKGNKPAAKKQPQQKAAVYSKTANNQAKKSSASTTSSKTKEQANLLKKQTPPNKQNLSGGQKGNKEKTTNKKRNLLSSKQ